MSAYLGDLIRADLKGGQPELPKALDANCLERLTAIFAPAWQAEMSARCENIDQAKTVEAFLKEFIAKTNNFEGITIYRKEFTAGNRRATLEIIEQEIPDNSNDTRDQNTADRE
ncbi:hypothetical protein [Pelagicoccus sp. SDUM812005]|uniref:hypothetical protein n=1 Tax=Pelagicoccus sp. SDUM812005 TaxID=3041257 RepID=UPI00280EB853|nr:hypothetical protein [Pelagicoccus sp. SDUM812005]MDQ8181889.1 hypothetical protein [Pelagicoccus sp. SDUM812005]